jgi:hypothetical protein
MRGDKGVSKDTDYSFGTVTVSCDYPKCSEEYEAEAEGFDGHPPQYKDVQAEIKEEGWRSKTVDGDWVDYCPEHSGAES